ncbi:hypothetical protein PR048_026244 [Dryococelus australis]|uniref:Uncharacterized protein n=1 Tax=Dryococelus australis TaxID=614101 RepID=A0ABQ9GKT2_9NEOP|nr:hypothetical protein PR048_026244 [Dryococelus australis]
MGSIYLPEQMQTEHRTVESVKQVIHFFKDKHNPSQVLKQIQQERQRKETSLLYPTETRWGSVTKCLDRTLKCKHQITSVDRLVRASIPTPVRNNVLDDGCLLDIKHRKEFCFHPVQHAACLLDQKQKGSIPTEETSVVIQTISDIADTITDVDAGVVLDNLAECKAEHKAWSIPTVSSSRMELSQGFMLLVRNSLTFACYRIQHEAGCDFCRQEANERALNDRRSAPLTWK